MESCGILSVIPAPLVAVCIYLFLRFKFPNGKFGLLHKAFILGILGIIPIYFFDKLLVFLHLTSLHSLNRTLFYSFVLTAGAFELWKFLILRLLVYPSKQVVKPVDMIAYSVIIAAGFTSAYSVYALYFAPPYINVCMYALTSGPAFVSIALIMGYFTGISLNRQYPAIDMVTGLFLAVVFQGIYRFCLLASDSILLYLAIGGMLVTGLTLFFISIRETKDSD